MRQQSYYYLNNKKYVGLLSNMDSLLTEVSNFYQHQARRKVVVVIPDNSMLMEHTVLDTARETLLKYNPLLDESQMNTLFEIKQFSEVDNLNYLNNDEKVFLLFFVDMEMMTVYKKYQKALLKSIGEEARISDFLPLVFKRDVLVSYDPDGSFKAAVANSDSITGSYEDYPEVPGSKLWSYDILFFVNDHIPCEVILTYLKEKFTIHGMKNINEMLSQFIQKVTYISPLIGMLEFMEKYHGYDKQAFIARVFHQDNPIVAVYSLKEFWDLMDATPGMIEKMQNHEDWDYYETYREYGITWNMMIRLAEQGYTDTTVQYVRNYWDQVEFLHRRKQRIPYLMNSVWPLDYVSGEATSD